MGENAGPAPRLEPERHAAAGNHDRFLLVRQYLLFAGMWTRASWQYRASVLLLTMGQFLATGLDIAVIKVLFTNVPRLAGFSLAEVAFLYGTSATSFAVSNLLFGSMERIGERIRDGSLDVMLVRPVGLLVQVATDGFSPRRLGGLAQGLGVLGLAIAGLDVPWNTGRVLLVPVLLTAGVALFSAIWIIGAAVQFFVQQTAEAMNSVTYGGNFLTQYPMSLYGRQGMRTLTFIVPLAFLNWQPALYVLAKPDPLDLPIMVRFASPLVAAAGLALAAAAWRTGLRHYRSTGN
ncbi:MULTISPECIES: ABC transporter permease [unclassified Frankia]|uniref:ABC transporter permease n=1 Tax=unclassified Frankia TaxID=2632575 RepID=UPI001EF69D67|nr:MULTISPECIES: ABC transporter permease [unclassified Frankia]